MSESFPDPTSERIVALESVVMHLQHDVETLNSVILQQQREIEALKRVLQRVDERLNRFDANDQPFDPVLEKPPHY